MAEYAYNELEILQKGIEQSIDGIAVANLEGIVTFVNKAWADMHGMAINEILHEHLKQFHNDYQLQNDVIPFNEVVLAKGKNIGYVGHVKKDGTPFPTWMSTTAFSDTDGKAVGLLAVCRDISELKAYEEEILRQKEAAEIANIVKNEFLLKVSHELRTPLNGIIGSAQLLELTELEEEQREYLASLQESASRFMGLIENLLNLSTTEKLTEGEVHKVEFNIDELLVSILRSHRSFADKNAVTLIKNIGVDVPVSISQDQPRINHILVNLISNGIKFTRNGEVKLTVETDCNFSLKKCVKFCVADTGKGISPENVNKIFGRFVQEDSSTTRSFEGMGVGLYVSRVLAERLGGSLTVKSKVGEGSTFCLSIPIE
ncbi:PAS domain S-box protein [candidate division KSB1 bacterium]|nr:PAS domain S-box protein [candidate division KSB1 bacterium]